MNEEEKIWKLREELNKSNLNLDSLRRQIKQLSNFNEKQEYDYLNCLLYPEKMKGVRIPSKTPLPTCTFQLRSTVSVSPININNEGKLLLIITPYFLGNKFSEPYTYTFENFNNHVYYNRYTTQIRSISPSAYSGNFNTTDNLMNELVLNQFIDKDIYNMYRLVSASVNISYIGALDQAQGVIGGGIYIGDTNYLNGTQRIITTLGSDTVLSNNMREFKDFNNVRHLPYYREGNCLEGLRMLYFPVDNKSLEFKHLFTLESIYQVGYAYSIVSSIAAQTLFFDSDEYDGRFAWIICGEHLPLIDNCIKIDLYCNFECIPCAKMLNYIPISLNAYYISENELNEIWKKIKDKCVNILLNK